MEKIASFTINHLDLEPGVYVSRKDRYGDAVITTFDLRMTAPNREPVMNTAEMHTIEHLFATFVRNSAYSDQIIYFGPMGCRTGFYFLTRDMDDADVLSLIRETLHFIADFEGDIPGVSAIECGNWQDHDLEGARRWAAPMAALLANWSEEQLTYPE